jgi:curved DNA-binding protein CbpA
MAPPTITEDYYSTLGVDQNATLELITKAYRRLALTLHPDRGGSTQAFQLLGLAYETLNDETKRRAYDRIYPSIRLYRESPQSSNPTKQSETRRDDDLLATLRCENEARSSQWKVEQEGLMPPIIALQRSIRALEKETKDLRDAADAAAPAAKARERNLTASDHFEGKQDETARKERRRQKRRARRDEIKSKEWQLSLQEAALQEKQKVLYRAEAAIDAANFINNRKMRAIEVRRHGSKVREQRERERERREDEKLQKLMRQAEEAHAAARKRQTKMQESRRTMRAQQAEAQMVEADAQRTARDAAQSEEAMRGGQEVMLKE